MKNKLIYSAIAVAALGLASCGNKSTTNDVTQLPEASQQVLNDNFNSDVASINIEKNVIGADEYEVFLNDGTKVEFENEEWEEVTAAPGQAVPEYFVIEPIRQYLTANQPDLTVVKVKKDSKGYEVDLSNGLELEFDNNGTFVKIDR